ncbi:hypothetical protein LAZ67_1004118 [Cordylochernes scorpioides]|uniref:Reverse transcriptase domain-containing protein n=1 Tax=Cordylochernes scorpioides TaxID=51811 RepID=A0ABY6JYS3_9ARAC|nr:hypothetical protein LAZ67_1004118 [Cordylochernes scorpioides]
MKQNLKLYVKHNISADKIAYLSSKKKYSAILKLKKREYTDKIQVILCNVKDPSQFWKTINSLKYRNNLQGEISTADWQVFYRELLGSNLTKVVQLPLEILDIDPELDCEISLTEIIKEISKLGKNKATGLDEIPNEAIKYLDIQVPQQWTKTIIHPIFKNGDPDNPSNYRGISLISNLSKLFTSILKTRLNDWMERKSILAENQAGFRKGYSCQDHIFTLVSLIQMTLSRRRGKLYAFFIDLRKAFDTVPHHLLWKKLALNGLSCRFIKLIKNYYTQMTATVRWRGSFTEAIKIQAGVLQGEPFCSVSCYKIHKASPDCQPVPTPVVETPAPKEIPFATEDTVPLEALEKIREDPCIRQCLRNPHLREYLKKINGSHNVSRSLDYAVYEPLFKEFEERCYDIIEGKVDPPAQEETFEQRFLRFVEQKLEDD